MASRPSRAGIEMSFTVGKTKRQACPDADVPFRILVLGDFGGRRDRASLDATVRLRAVDLCEVDATLAALAPRLELELGEGRCLSIRFGQLDDFHPNHLFETLDVFAPLKLLRQDLRTPSRSAGALARIRAKTSATEDPGTSAKGDASTSDADSTPGSPGGSSTPTTARSAPESEGDLVARLFGSPSARQRPDQSARFATGPNPASAVRAGSPEGFVDALIAPLVSLQTVARPDPELAQVQAGVDEACGIVMRSILHHPQFRALEASWRGLSWLCNQLGQAGNIELAILDVSKEALSSHWDGCAELRESPLHALISEAGRPESDSAPWALIVGDYEFDSSAEDVRALHRMAALAEGVGAAFVAGADWARFAEATAATPDDPSAAFAALRSQPESSCAGLVAPRFLLRLPYGKKTDPVDGFDFEELEVASAIGACLWGNGALACAAVLGMAFGREGWGFSPGDELEVRGLPIYVYREDGEAVQAPCAEAWISSSIAEHMSNAGLMVLQSIRGRDAARMLRIQSIHDPATPLRGPWA